MSTRARLAALTAVALTACPPQPMPEPEEDAGEEPIPVYDGEAISQGIPDHLPMPRDVVLFDSGVIMVDRTCCTTNFGIDDREPAGGVTGVLRIELSQFADGVALTRGAGRWTATACFPVNQSATYFYEFTRDGGTLDAGTIELDDGGFEWVSVRDESITIRASDEGPTVSEVDGTARNFFRSVPTCDGLDGSVPR